MNKKGFAIVHGILGVLWIAIIVIYALILFFPVSVEVSSSPFGAEVFLSSQKVGETPTKIHPIPQEGTWVTVFKVEHLPYCLEFVRAYKGGIYANLIPADGYKKIEVGVAEKNVAYVNFIPDFGEPKKLSMDEYGGFFQLLDEQYTKSEEDLKKFLMNCYSNKEITIKHIK